MLTRAEQQPKQQQQKRCTYTEAIFYDAHIMTISTERAAPLPRTDNKTGRGGKIRKEFVKMCPIRGSGRSANVEMRHSFAVLVYPNELFACMKACPTMWPAQSWSMMAEL